MVEDMAEKQEGITISKDKDFSEWYGQVIIKSGFVDYTAVSGCLAFRPDGYFAWESVMRATDELFKKEGIQNTYFPLLIPEKFLKKEKEHVEGFTPEVAWVTHTGDSKLDERLAVRPTSETIMYDSFAKWIRSWRDLPLRLNQWNGVLRWEFKHPVPLLRSREFLWNEGHTAFATKDEAAEERDVILGIYVKILKEYLAIAGIVGRKSDKEKFAGAEATFSIEHVLPSGKTVQGPDFHNDGQRFAKAFNITFLDKNGKSDYVYQNTFAISTRELGVMVALHGDDKGVVIPPMISRIQVVIVPIYREESMKEVMTATADIAKRLRKKFRVHVDDRDSYSPGWKFNEWELRGIPVRIEIGAKELKEKKAVAARRDTGEKAPIAMDELEDGIETLLNEIQLNLYNNAKKFLESNVRPAKNYEELKKILDEHGGMVEAGWCGSQECEDKIRDETGAKITNMPFDTQKKAKGAKCVYCGKPAKNIANFGRSY